MKIKIINFYKKYDESLLIFFVLLLLIGLILINEPILSSSLLASVAYLLKNFVFQPFMDLKATSGKIQNRLKYRAREIFSVNAFKPKVIDEISIEIRQLSCDVEENYYKISFRKTMEALKIIPSPEDLVDVGRALMYISNSMNDDDYDKKFVSIEEIKNILGII